MKASTIISSILLLAAPALSAPAGTPTFTPRQLSNSTITKNSNSTIANNSNSTITKTNTNSSSTSGGFSSTTTLYPSLQVRWSSKSRALRSTHSTQGHLLNSESEKVTTAVYFNLPADQVKGKTCKLVFRLTNDDWLSYTAPARVQPSERKYLKPQFDIFRLTHCLNVGYGWDNRIEQGANIGLLSPAKASWDAKKGREAEWLGTDLSADTLEPYMGAAPTWSCVPGEYSFELVAREGLNLGWDLKKGSGLSIEVCG